MSPATHSCCFSILSTQAPRLDRFAELANRRLAKAHVLILRHECSRKLTEHPVTGRATAAPIALMAYIQDVSDLSLPEAQVAEMGRQSSLSKLRKEVCFRLGGKRISALWKVRYSCHRVELCNRPANAPIRVFLLEPAVANLPQAEAHLFQVEELLRYERQRLNPQLHTHSHPFIAI